MNTYLLYAPERNTKDEIVDLVYVGHVKAPNITEAMRRAKQDGQNCPMLRPKQKGEKDVEPIPQSKHQRDRSSATRRRPA